jgi:predicted RNase H-like nuclease (RuvC/YqgF family)
MFKGGIMSITREQLEDKTQSLDIENYKQHEIILKQGIEIEKLQAESERQSLQIKELHEYIEVLKKKNEILKEALEEIRGRGVCCCDEMAREALKRIET